MLGRPAFGTRFERRGSRSRWVRWLSPPFWSWQYPVHRNAVATRRRADELLRVRSAHPTQYLNRVTSDSLSTTQAVPFVVERVPLSELVETSQSAKLLLFRPVSLRHKRHSADYADGSRPGTIGQMPDFTIGRNLTPSLLGQFVCLGAPEARPVCSNSSSFKMKLRQERHGSERHVAPDGAFSFSRQLL
jgi:hypothetical protein